MREMIFVDTETTGLDDEHDDLVELTYASRDSEPHTLWFGVTEVPEFIDNLIGFTKRGISGRRSDHFEVEEFLKVSDGATMVAAVPAFDQGFINKAGLWRFHYRTLDIQSYAMAKLGLSDVPSMKDLATFFENEGYELTQPDHTSRNDVLAMREMFLLLENM